MEFRTVIPIERQPLVDYSRPFLLLGSCFSEHIGSRLQQRRFPGCVNPFGVLYNPLSILRALRRLWEQRPFSADELFAYGGLWHSAMHHGSFSSPDADKALDAINGAYLAASANISEVKTYLITFGSSWVYEDAQGDVVANCHKMPQSRFKQRRLTVSEIVEAWRPLIAEIRRQVPDAAFLFTVSPMRYREHGALAAGTNKAVLLLAIEELLKEEGVYYFPSYEIVMDELRDYRFYAADMIHPSDTAVEYIWQRFADTHLTRESQALLKEVELITKQLAHRPLHPDSRESQQAQETLQRKIRDLQQRHPEITF